MKPRLADAPNGIVGGPGSRARGDLLGIGASSHATHSASTVPIEMLSLANSDASSSPRPPRSGSFNVAPRPTAPRAAPAEVVAPTSARGVEESSSSRGTHRRTLSDTQSSGSTSPRRMSHYRMKNGDNTGPLQQDTRQLELVEKSLGEKTANRQSIFVTLRSKNARNNRSTVALDSLVDADSSSSMSADVSVDSKSRATGGKLLKAGGVFARTSGTGGAGSRTSDMPRKPQWPEQGPVSVQAGGAGGGKTGAKQQQTVAAGANAGAGAPAASTTGEKRVGFFAKLIGRTKKVEAEPAQPKPQRFVFSAAELEAREAQLAAAGFSQLPGTLLSRAKGDAVDAKYLLKWNQFDLRREIGEGAYAMVYLATVKLETGAKKDVALKELKLLGNEQNEDLHLEVAAVADAIGDCGFTVLAESVRLGAELIRQPEKYREARSLLRCALLEFKQNADMEDEACGQILAVVEALIALPPPPKQPATVAGKGAPQRLVEDIMREVEVLSKLWHKNIVEFVGTCVDLPHLAIAMQYAHKGPLSELLINDEVVLGWDLRIKWAKETAEAIHYLHSLDPKIIHRDLTDNILIDQNNVALVTDFGLSKAKALNMMNPAGVPQSAGRRMVEGPSGADAKYKSFVQFSEIAGTPSYMAPELWRNEAYTESVDVYSFGMVLWELLARDAPYRELDNDALMTALRNQKLRPEIPKWTPEAFRLLTERCWADSPSVRPNFDQVVKLLKILEEKHAFTWVPPSNYSLDDEVQRQHMVAWQKEKEDKEMAMKAAEKKLLQAQQQLKTAKASVSVDLDHLPSAMSPGMTHSGLLPPSPAHAPDQSKKKKPSTDIYIK